MRYKYNPSLKNKLHNKKKSRKYRKNLLKKLQTIINLI
jgi:hypothetical protein